MAYNARLAQYQIRRVQELKEAQQRQAAEELARQVRKQEEEMQKRFLEEAKARREKERKRIRAIEKAREKAEAKQLKKRQKDSRRNLVSIYIVISIYLCIVEKSISECCVFVHWSS